MIKQTENFIITDIDETVRVDYVKSAKDWFDTIIILLLGFALSFATYLLLKNGFETTRYIVIIAGLIFAFQAVLQTTSGLSRLFQPTKRILIIDKKKKLIISRLVPFVTRKFPIENLKSIQIKGQKENLLGKKLERTYCEIVANLRDNKTKTLFVINTKKFIRTSTREIETEIYLNAKRLVSELNIHLKSSSKWAGYHEEE